MNVPRLGLLVRSKANTSPKYVEEERFEEVANEIKAAMELG